MKNIDLETFYKRIDTSINIVCSYIGNKRLRGIITSCRLKPITIFDNTFKSGLQTWWVDEFGNSLLLRDNAVEIILVDKNIKIDSQISTDLFGCRSLLDTMRDAKSVVISELDSHICFIGQDEYLRCWNLDGERTSPLSLGVENLFRLIEFKDYKYKDFEYGMVIYKLPSYGNKIEKMLEKEFSKNE